MPVEALPRGPVLQQASTKPGTWQTQTKQDRSADAGLGLPTQQAAMDKPLGSVLGLAFGSAKPTYRAFTLGPATPGQ
jgi:hypothetical protein